MPSKAVKLARDVRRAKKVARAVCAKSLWTMEELLEDGRGADAVAMRVKVIKVLREEGDFSMPVIAKVLGYKDHTTVLHHMHRNDIY